MYSHLPKRELKSDESLDNSPESLLSAGTKKLRVSTIKIFIGAQFSKIKYYLLSLPFWLIKLFLNDGRSVDSLIVWRNNRVKLFCSQVWQVHEIIEAKYLPSAFIIK